MNARQWCKGKTRERVTEVAIAAGTTYDYLRKCMPYRKGDISPELAYALEEASNGEMTAVALSPRVAMMAERINNAAA